MLTGDKWEVVVFDDPQLTQFALPGGKLVSTQVLLDLLLISIKVLQQKLLES